MPLGFSVFSMPPATHIAVHRCLYTVAFLTFSFSSQSFTVLPGGSICLVVQGKPSSPSIKLLIHAGFDVQGAAEAGAAWGLQIPPDTKVTSDLATEGRERREISPCCCQERLPSTPAKSPSCPPLSCQRSFPRAAPKVLSTSGSWTKGVTSNQFN